MSRPFIDKENPLDHTSRVVLNRKEYDFIVSCASIEGISFSQFMRNAVREYVSKKGYKPVKQTKPVPKKQDLPDLY